MTEITLVLASTSPRRRALFGLLGLSFALAAPTVDESPAGNESPAEMARRLSLAKARSVAWPHDRALIVAADPLDKAAAYAIQHPRFRPVERLQGCYTNVMGLPLCHLYLLLRRVGFDRSPWPERACRDFTGYDCPIAQGILVDGDR